MHKYITLQVFKLVGTEVKRVMKVANRVCELMDYEIVEVVQDDQGFGFEWLTQYKVPVYSTKYLRRLIERELKLNCYCWTMK